MLSRIVSVLSLRVRSSGRRVSGAPISLAVQDVASEGIHFNKGPHASLKATRYQANRVLAPLSAIFNFTIKAKLIAENPAKRVKKFIEERRDNWLSVAVRVRSSRCCSRALTGAGLRGRGHHRSPYE